MQRNLDVIIIDTPTHQIFMIYTLNIAGFLCVTDITAFDKKIGPNIANQRVKLPGQCPLYKEAKDFTLFDGEG